MYPLNTESYKLKLYHSILKRASGCFSLTEKNGPGTVKSVFLLAGDLQGDLLDKARKD